jgi:hypothetical protein
VLDLGLQPLTGSFPRPAERDRVERAPLRLGVCTRCWWLQLLDDTPDEIDPGGPPAIETSSSIREHAEELAGWLVRVRSVGSGDRILELASHGNVLASVLHARGLTNTTTVERHENALATSRAAGLAVVEGRLDADLAARLAGDRPFDLVLDTFDLAHRRTPGEELSGIARAIADDGTAVVEVEHALPLLVHGRFDSVRHGHFGYPSLVGLRWALQDAGLEAIAAKRTAIYGGAIRLVLARIGALPVEASVSRLLAAERGAGMADLSLYDRFARRVERRIGALRKHLADAAAAGRRVVGYGAPSRASTLLNAAGIGPAVLAYTADVSPTKQGREIPGTGIPIVPPARLVRDRPDEVLILTWSIADEVVGQLVAAGLEGSRFVVPLPSLRMLPPKRPARSEA